MELQIIGSNYKYASGVVTRIIHFMRILKEYPSHKLLLIGNEVEAKLLLTIASLLAGKLLYVVKDFKEAWRISIEEGVSLIFETNILSFEWKKIATWRHIDQVYTIHVEDLFSNQKDFDFVESSINRGTSLIEPYLFKDESKSLEKAWNYRMMRDTNVLNVKIGKERITYNSESIFQMLKVLNSEFENEKNMYVDVLDLDYNKHFIYFIYFLMIRGDCINFDSIEEMILNNQSTKKLIFSTGEMFNKMYHRRYKYDIYSRLNLFLDKWWITRWITKFTYAKALAPYLNKRDEIIFINLEHSLAKLKFLERARTKISTIYGTPADGHTLGINRYNDKEIKIVDNSFRIMDHENDIKLEKDTLNILYLSGKRIPLTMRTAYAIQSKRSNDLYYCTNLYCDIIGEILTIKGTKTDIYYKNRTPIDIGTKRNALLSIPYVKEAMIIKILDKFIAIVSIHFEFVSRKFEPKPVGGNGLLRTLEHLKLKTIQINKNFPIEEKISKIVVNDSFFDELEEAKNLITEEDFIEYLNQQPLNYLERFFQEEGIKL